MGQVRKRLLRVVERVRRALLERVAREGLQVLGRQQLRARQRVVLAYEYVHVRVEQRGVRHVGVGEGLLQHAPVEAVGVEHAHLAAERAHVVDDLAGAALAQDELVVVSLALLHDVHERLHAERVVLRGHGQPQVGGAFIGVAHLQHVGLLDHLARVA